jgi:hypothetical protein
MSPLHVAVTQPPGRENIIKILLDAGAPIDKQSVYHGLFHYLIVCKSFVVLFLVFF